MDVDGGGISGGKAVSVVEVFRERQQNGESSDTKE